MYFGRLYVDCSTHVHMFVPQLKADDEFHILMGLSRCLSRLQTRIKINVYGVSLNSRQSLVKHLPERLNHVWKYSGYANLWIIGIILPKAVMHLYMMVL